MSKESSKKARYAGIKAENIAKIWLESKKKYKIEFWHEGKASNLPFDIICSKNEEIYAFDVKGGINPKLALKSFKKLLSLKKEDFVESTKHYRHKYDLGDIKKPVKFGYIFVIEDECVILLTETNPIIAYKAWKTINKKIDYEY